MRTWDPEADLVIQHPKIYTVAITCDEVKEGKTDFPIIEDGGVAAKDGKVSLIAMATDGAVKKGAHAGNLIKGIAGLVGGGGGGRPNMAQAGGKKPEGIDAALAEAKTVLESQIG